MKYRLTAIAAALLLAACSSVSQAGKSDNPTIRKENKTMSDTEINPKLTPKKLLTRLLTLLETSESVDDFTPKRLEEIFGVPVQMDKEDKDRHEFHEKVTKNWGYRFSVGTNISGIKLFILSFNWLGDKSIAHPEMTEVCEMKFDEFIEKAEAIGFSAKPVYAKGNVFRGGTLSNGKLLIQIRTAAEHPWDERGRGKSCIESLRIFSIRN